MPEIEISIDEPSHVFTLSGDVEHLSGNKRARLFLRDYLLANFVSDSQIVIPYTTEEKENTLTEVRDLLSKYNIKEVRSGSVDEVLKEYFQEEKNFTVFSEKANEIRNNNCDLGDFRAFTDLLSKQMVNRKLYALQLLSAYHLAFAQNGCNFSVPGAGKTSVVYGAYAYLNALDKDDPKYIDKILIIGPLSSFGPWEDEYQSCFGRKPNSKRLSGGTNLADRTNYFYSSSTCDVTLMSYAGVASMLDDIIFFLKKNHVMVVLDEAHKIKNTEGGIWAESVLKLAKFCKSRVVLTGTPIPNGYEDLYNLYNFIWPDKNVIGYHPYQLKDMSSNPYDQRVPQLTKNISPFFIRIKKSDLNLPVPISHPPTIVPMGPVQREIYDYIEKSYMPYFESVEKETGKSNVRNALVKSRMIRLMQAATNPSLLQKPIDKYFNEEGLSNELFIDNSSILKKIISYNDIEVPAKFAEATRLIKDIIARGEKVIVWTTFVRNIFDLQSYLNTLGIPSNKLCGEVPVDNEDLPDDIETRESIIREFHKPDCEFKVIIANPFAVAESISLHKACHNAIYLERTFNAAHFMQSKDRIHRVGLRPDDIVNYYYLLSENSVDRVIHERLEMKEKRMLDAIENEPIPLINMNMDYEEDMNSDIKALIRDYVRRTSPI